jgi:diazepam-binding inhibitor (GABA receptor modulating acyl-CoA-binding protein)
MNPPVINSQEFLIATNTVKSLKKTPDGNELLELYGWYKQATVGDINIPKPSMLNFKDSSKWNSWNEKKGTDVYNSEIKYIKFLNTLIKKYGLNKNDN